MPTIRTSWLLVGTAAAVLLGGCAADAIRTGKVAHYRQTKGDTNVARKDTSEDIATGSIDKQGPVTSKQDPRWQWCEQRHIDHQAGKAPGGATDLAKKLDDDRICAAVYSGNQ
jgi:hypothetical protein